MANWKEKENKMSKISIRDVTYENIEDLCSVCIPPDKRNDPKFIAGIEEKREWAIEMLRLWDAFAKLAYEESAVVGFIQYEPVLKEGVVRIHCIYVPEEEHWRKGIARQLVSGLLEEMKKPKAWFNNQPVLALVTKTFPGEKPGQYPAHSFFIKEGFKQAGEDPDLLYYPLKEGFVYQPLEEKEVEYIPQEEDKGKGLIIYGPSFCPFAYAFLKMTEQAIKEIAPGIPIRWIDKSKEPEEVKKRGYFEGCVVNAKPIMSFTDLRTRDRTRTCKKGRKPHN